MGVRAVFHSLKGNWTFQRTVSGEARAEGTASFTRNWNTLNYYESGVLHRFEDKKSFHVYQTYSYRLRNDLISVYFSNKQLFHPLHFDPPNPTTFPFIARGTHHCEPDTYEMLYQFDNLNQFRVTCAVKGPHKNYEIYTVFQKKLYSRM
jgi:hypothetical protein